MLRCGKAVECLRMCIWEVAAPPFFKFFHFFLQYSIFCKTMLSYGFSSNTEHDNSFAKFAFEYLEK